MMMVIIIILLLYGRVLINARAVNVFIRTVEFQMGRCIIIMYTVQGDFQTVPDCTRFGVSTREKYFLKVFAE